MRDPHGAATKNRAEKIDVLLNSVTEQGAAPQLRRPNPRGVMNTVPLALFKIEVLVFTRSSVFGMVAVE